MPSLDQANLLRHQQLGDRGQGAHASFKALGVTAVRLRSSVDRGQAVLSKSCWGLLLGTVSIQLALRWVEP